MTDEKDRAGEDAPSPSLSDDETEAVAERKAGSAKVVHEVIRLQGDEELERPVASLIFSAFAAGVAISVSVLAQAFIKASLPDQPWAELIVALGYTVGFVIVIMGNLQLFTENTVTAILPIATHPTVRNLRRLTKLWSSVLIANLAGTLLVAALMSGSIIISADQLAASVQISSKLLYHDALTTLWLGMPAGFLVASIAWILPNARGSEFWVVMLITYIIAIGGFSHVVAGSTEAWLLWLTGRISLQHAVFGIILPALVGNIVGGTGLFAVLAHGQVRGEIKPSEAS
jgi:formate/nitrite transporter FocA (FNT family)